MWIIFSLPLQDVVRISSSGKSYKNSQKYCISIIHQHTSCDPKNCLCICNLQLCINDVVPQITYETLLHQYQWSLEFCSLLNATSYSALESPLEGFLLVQQDVGWMLDGTHNLWILLTQDCFQLQRLWNQNQFWVGSVSRVLCTNSPTLDIGDCSGEWRAYEEGLVNLQKFSLWLLNPVFAQDSGISQIN